MIVILINLSLRILEVLGSSNSWNTVVDLMTSGAAFASRSIQFWNIHVWVGCLFERKEVFRLWNGNHKGIVQYCILQNIGRNFIMLISIDISYQHHNLDIDNRFGLAIEILISRRIPIYQTPIDVRILYTARWRWKSIPRISG